MTPNMYQDSSIPTEFPTAIAMMGGEVGTYVARFTPGDEYGGAVTPARRAKSKLKDCNLIRVGGISCHYWNPIKEVWVDYKGNVKDIRPPA